MIRNESNCKIIFDTRKLGNWFPAVIIQIQLKVGISIREGGGDILIVPMEQ